jgi:predicted CXXCH cytochrome family protein
MRKTMLITPVSAHAAVREGRCGSCHDPHFSATPALLRKPQNELCPSCHEALVRSPGGAPWAVGHKPVEENKCRLCHRSHTSANRKLLKAPEPQSCRPCHGEFFAATEGAGVASVHKPVRNGACAACHELHGGALAKLLKEGVRGAVCGGCHPNPAGAHHQFSAAQLKASGNESRAEVSGCLLCHLPHASAHRRLLLAPGSAVCQSCHKP